MSKNHIMRLMSLSVIFVLLLCGCANTKGKIQQALNEKYSENFTVIETKKAEAGGFYYLARPEQNPEIVIKGSANDDCTVLSDNYYVRRMCHDMKSQAESIFGPDCAIGIFNTYEYTIAESKDLTLSQFLRDNPTDNIGIYVFTDDSAELSELYRKAMETERHFGARQVYTTVYILSPGELSKLQKELEQKDDFSEENYDAESATVPLVADELYDVPTEEQFIEALTDGKRTEPYLHIGKNRRQL